MTRPKSILIGGAVSLALSLIVCAALSALLFWLHPEAARSKNYPSFAGLVGALIGFLGWWHIGSRLADWLENRETRT